MSRMIWHYFCRSLQKGSDTYFKYLLISVHSLIYTAGVDPKDIIVSLDIYDHDYMNVCIQKIISYGINLRKAPKYKNHAKCTNLCSVIQNNPDVDKIVQIDCDTIITDENIIAKLMQLDGSVNHTTMDWPITKVLQSRNGLKHPMFSAQHYTNNIYVPFSVNNENIAEYTCFKDFLNIVFDFNLDEAIQVLSQETKMFVGYAFVLSPKIIPKEFFKFIAILDLFFGCDETIFTLARIYSKLEYKNINCNTNIVFGSKKISDFKTKRGIIHFPVKDTEIQQEIDNMVSEILLT